MRRRLQPASPSRAIAIGLALLMHVLLFLLALRSSRSPPQAVVEQIQFVSLWADIKPLTEPKAVEVPPPESTSRAKTTRPAPNVAPSATTLSNEDVSTAISPRSERPIDWQREATSAARRQAERPGELENSNAQPKTARKPCEPSESSLVWNPETPRAGFTRTPIPLPFVQLGKRCMIGLGFFGCTLGALPEANSHLFDDIAEGKTMKSSVPDPHICD
jgi:hypothetical protein